MDNKYKDVVCRGTGQRTGVRRASTLAMASATALGALAISAQVAAMVTVNGNRISWPDDGWYQVQNRQTQQITCQGARSCVVEDGVYDVQRFTANGGSSNIVTVGEPADLSVTRATFPATLTVTGRTINWSVAGWYQIQNADTLQTICNGEPSCTVPTDGRYIVINHSLGLRANVDVGSGDTTPTSPTGPPPQNGPIQINGNVISWPDDGWYQVQRADNFTAVCNGGSQCSVQPGEYIVINHTSGTRYDNIVVGNGGGTTPTNNAIQVDGNRISWPDNGWYQVQRADTFATVCQGVRFCDAPAGEYIVINHSLDQRFTGITVAGNGTGNQGATAVNSDNAVRLVRQAFEVLNGRAYDMRFLNAGEINPAAQGLAVVSTSVNSANGAAVTQFSCSNGGTARQELQRLGISTRVFTVDYSNCQVNGDLINGRVIRDLAVGNNDNIKLTFNNYALTFQPGGRMSVNGMYQVITGNRPSAIVGQNLVTADNLRYSFSFSGGSLSLGNVNTDYDFILSRACCSVDDSITLRRAGDSSDFIMSPPGFDSSFRVSVLETLETTNTRDDRFFSGGLLRISSERDGSSLLFSAVTSDFNNASITISNRGQDGPTVAYPWTTWNDVFRFR